MLFLNTTLYTRLWLPSTANEIKIIGIQQQVNNNNIIICHLWYMWIWTICHCDMNYMSGKTLWVWTICHWKHCESVLVFTICLLQTEFKFVRYRTRGMGNCIVFLLLLFLGYSPRRTVKPKQRMCVEPIVVIW